MSASPEELIRRLRSQAENDGTEEQSIARNLRSQVSKNNRGALVMEDVFSVYRNFAEGFNSGLAEMIGAPASLVNTVVESFGGPEDYFFSTKDYKRAFGAVGIGTSPKPGIAGSIGREAAFSLPAVVGQFAAASSRLPQAMQRSQQAGLGSSAAPAPGRTIIGEVVEQTARRPGAVAAAEGASVVGAGAGAEIAREAFPESPIAEPLGAVAGSVVSQIPSAAAQAVRSIPSAARAIVDPLTEKAIRKQAADVLQSQSSHPGKSAERLENAIKNVEGLEIRSPQIADDVGLMEFENAIIQQDAVFSGRMKEAAELNALALRDEMKAVIGSDVDNSYTLQWLSGRADKLLKRVDDRVRLAAKIAHEKSGPIVPKRGKTTNSKILRAELDQALKDARAEETRLWELAGLGRSVSETPAYLVDVSPVKQWLKQRVFNTSKARKGEIPGDIKRIIKDYGEDILDEAGDVIGSDNRESITELMGADSLYSKARDRMRTSRAGATPNNFEKRFFSDLADVIDDTVLLHIESLADPTLEAKLKAARAYSVGLNDKFTRGPVGQVMGFKTTGELRTNEQLTAAKLLLPDEKGGLTADALLEATGGSESALDAARDYIRGKFDEMVVEPGFTRARADRFMRRYSELLGRPSFQGIRDELGNFSRAQAKSDLLAKQPKRARELLAKSQTGLYLDFDDPQKAVARVLSSKQPAKQMRELIIQANGDKTGLALEGLRRTMAETLTNMAKLQPLRTTVRNSLGEVVKKHSLAIQELYTPAQQARLDKIVNAAAEVARGRTSSRNIALTDEGGFVMNALMRVGFYKGASAVGANPLVLSSQGGKVMKKIAMMIGSEERVRKVIEEAIFNKDLMTDLLLATPKTVVARQKMLRRMRGHLISMGLRPLDEEQAAAIPGPPAENQQQSTLGIRG